MTDAPRHQVPAYGSYLQLERLLGAQSPPDYAHLAPDDAPDARVRDLAHHDEMLFIVVHQVFELWFKLVLHELSRARDILGRQGRFAEWEQVPEDRIPGATSAILRVNEIFRIGIDQFRVMETMPPGNFLSFRDVIVPASGFQSVQFRELEILAGLPENMRMDFEGVPYAAKLTDSERVRLEQRRSELSLHSALLDWLARTPIPDLYPQFAEAYLAAYDGYADRQAAMQQANPNLAESQKVAAGKRCAAQKEEARQYLLGGDADRNRAHQAFVFIASYRRQPLLRWPSQLIDAIIAFEQDFRTFRFRHARMVERMIGLRTGTGGSAGVAYLDSTSHQYRIFGELLEARTFFLAPELVPELPRPDLLDFRFES